MRFLFVMVLTLVALQSAAQQSANLANGVVAIVNDAVITWEDVRRSIYQEEEILYRTYGNQPSVLEKKLEQLQRDAVEQLVERQLILHEFNTSPNFRLPEVYIEDSIKREIRENYGDRLRLTRTLQAQGSYYEAYRQRVRDRIIVTLLTAKNVSQEILVSPFKIERYYSTNVNQFKLTDRVKLRMITLEKKKHGEEGARKLAAEVLAKLAQGADFGEMAGVYSDDPQRREGGARGWEERTTLRADLAEVAFSLKSGERSPVVDRAEACYLMWVEEASQAHVQPLSEVREQIERDLVATEQKRLREQWINRLKAKQFIRYLPGL